MNILIADDEEMIRYSLRSMISDMNLKIIHTFEASDGEEMIKVSRKQRPDIILVDIRMPRVTGLEAIKACKTFLPKTKFIIISSYEDFEYAREAMKLGVNDYLLKPVKPEELKSAIESTIEEFNEPDDSMELVDQVKAFIENNYMHDIGTAQIARNFSITPNYLSHVFHKKAGVKLINYLTDLRMKKSVEYLKIPGIKIYQVAKKVGFPNSKHFTKIFLKYYECLPSEYQKNLPM
ncbi:MAG: response regulator [Spirochaetales bacterium]|nr:response regulator [Spirochaetales bacterium]